MHIYGLLIHLRHKNHIKRCERNFFLQKSHSEWLIQFPPDCWAPLQGCLGLGVQGGWALQFHRAAGRDGLLGRRETPYDWGPGSHSDERREICHNSKIVSMVLHRCILDHTQQAQTYACLPIIDRIVKT